MFDNIQEEPRNIDSNTPIAVTMTAMQWAMITDGIRELPFKIAAPLLQEVTRQLMEATKPQQPPAIE